MNRNKADVYSLVDIDNNHNQSSTHKSNLVVDTIRIISGIPQSRMNDILSEAENYSVDPMDDELLDNV